MNFYDKDMVIFVGDVHEKFTSLEYFIEQRGIENALIIVCGDFGMGFCNFDTYKVLFDIMNTNLDYKNNDLLIVRGNHDDPSYFERELVYGDRIKLVKDYSTVSVNGYNILCIGGATSIDMMDRTINIDWWPGEELVFNEIINEIRDIDFVVTHTAPVFCLPPLKYFHNIYEELNLKITEERKTLERVYVILKTNNPGLKKWFYGHFHNSENYMYDGVNFICLNELEFKEIYL